MADQPIPTAERDDLEEVTIKLRAFPYYADVLDLVTGRMVRQERVAVRGETVKLAPHDYTRAVKFDAIVAQGETPESPSGGVPGWDPNTQSLDAATVEDVSLWIQREKPTVPQVVEEANADPALAQKLLDAENHATGGKPRSTLEEELQGIIGGS